jgi:hypothetical protein
MKVEIIDGMGRVTVASATRVLVTADDGTPALAAVEWMPGAISCGHAGEGDEFALMLRNMGIDRTVVVERFTPDPGAVRI